MHVCMTPMYVCTCMYAASDDIVGLANIGMITCVAALVRASCGLLWDLMLCFSTLQLVTNYCT